LIVAIQINELENEFELDSINAFPLRG